MHDDPPLFLPANFFLLRITSLPIDSLFSLLRENDPKQALIEKWLKDPFFREALALSSESLSTQIRRGKVNDPILRSLFKFFSRITSRPTPYGLFSFVSWGEVGSHASSKLDLNLLSKRARPDMGWMQKYIEKIVCDPSELLNLEIQNHPIIIEKNDRYLINYFIDKTDQTTASIKKNQLTSLIFSYCTSSLKVSELLDLLQKDFPNIQTSKMIDVIQSLLDQQFLWHTLYPRLNTFRPFQELLQKVPERYKMELRDFENGIERYHATPLEQGEKELYHLLDAMSQVVKSSRPPIQLDLGISSKQIKLPQEVLNHVAKGGELLWKFSALHSREPPLKNYHFKFVVKYGLQRLVPLLELLDPHKGLGIPDDPDVTKKNQVNRPELNAYHEWLGEALTKTLKTGQKELIIDDEIIARFVQNVEREKACISTDLFFEIYADSSKSIDAGNYDIYINNFVDRAGTTFGRFMDLLDPEVTNRLKHFYMQESQLEKDVLIVESFYLPKSSDMQNVAISPSFNSNCINLSPTGISTLHLNDIYVGATKEHLYLTDAQGELEFRITSTNVLVDTHAPEQIRFIREVSRERSGGGIALWSWGEYATSTYLPQVKYENIVLSPQRWQTSLQLIQAKQDQTVEQIMDQLSNWANQWNLPKYVYITEGDNKLLINRFYVEHLKIAAAYLKKKKRIFFLEKAGLEEEHWVQSSKGRHCVEYVLPVLKNPHYVRKVRSTPKTSYQKYSPSKRCKLPGSEWLYYKFHLPIESHNAFLQHHLSPLGERLLEKGLIDQWFFIRFQENEHHQIRFRMKRPDQNLFPLSLLLDQMYQFSQDLLEASLIQDVSICSYEREIERYGGGDFIDLLEKFFCIDSLLAIELLQYESSKLPIYVIGVLSVLDLLQHLQFDKDKINALFHYLTLDKKELTGYRKWRKMIEVGFIDTFGSIGNSRATILMDIGEKLEHSPHHIFQLAASLIHMHCNRLSGVDATIENKVNAFTAHFIENSLRKDQLRMTTQ